MQSSTSPAPYPTYIWERQVLPNQGAFHCRIGPLSFYLRRNKEDWLWSFERLSEEASSVQMQICEAPPSHLEWARWTFASGVEKFRIVPQMLNKSIVVKPRFPLTLPPKNKIVFYVYFPLLFQILVEHEGHVFYVDPVESVPLNHVWYGDFLQGELCYSLLTKAFRDVSELPLYPHRVVSPVTIYNERSYAIPLEKICLRVERLSIYQGPDRLWTNDIHINLTNNQEVADVTYGNTPPGALGTAHLLNTPGDRLHHGSLKNAWDYSIGQHLSGVRKFLGDLQGDF